jgi:hypothetical protein
LAAAQAVFEPTERLDITYNNDHCRQLDSIPRAFWYCFVTFTARPAPRPPAAPPPHG